MEPPQEIILKFAIENSVIDFFLPHYIRWLNVICEKKGWNSVFERIDHGFLWILKDFSTFAQFMSALPSSYQMNIDTNNAYPEYSLIEPARTQLLHEKGIQIHMESTNYPVSQFYQLFINYFHDLDSSIRICLNGESLILIFPGVVQFFKYVDFITSLFTHLSNRMN